VVGEGDVPRQERGQGVGGVAVKGMPRRDPGGVVAVQPAAAVREQQRAVGTAAQGRIDRPDGPWRQGHQRALATLADHGQDPMGALHPEVADVSCARFRDPQTVQGEQAGKGVVAGAGGLGRGQEPDRLLAVQPKRLRVARHLGATNVGDGGVGERSFLDRMAVEAGQGGQPPGHGGATAPSLLELPGVGLDMDATDL
jgi:hypothetical protein